MASISSRPCRVAGPRRPSHLLVAVALAAATAHGHAADTSCAGLAQAVRAGLAQPRVHAAIDLPLDAAALKAGMKPTLLHSIVIGSVQHSNALSPTFRQVALNSPAERDLATDLAAFEADARCTLKGGERLAGRATQVWSFSIDLGRGEARIKVWVDSASGLPVRAVSDEPDVDVSTGFTKPGKGGASKFEVTERPNGQRVIGTHAYLYGDAVKPPGAKGAVDGAALAQLQALLKGAP